MAEDEKTIALHYIKTFSDTAREPFLILDSELRVIGANESFYKNFKVKKEDTAEKFIYELGNNQWDIPELRKLLEEILPEKSVFNDFEVIHEFPELGTRIMLLNARQLDDTKQILLAIEDITLKREIEVRLATYTEDLKREVSEKTAELQVRIDELTHLNEIMIGRELKMIELKKEIRDLKEDNLKKGK